METRTRTPRDMRVFAAGIAVITGAIALLLLYKGKTTAAVVLGGFSAYGIISLPLPVLITPLYIVFSYLALVLAWINTRLLLGLLFYLVFTPIGLFFRLIGRDSLERKLDREAESYWVPIPEVEPDVEAYGKQF